MAEQFWERYSIIRLDDEHSLNEVAGLSAYFKGILNIHPHLALVETLHRLRPERYGSLEHHVQKDSKGPDVDKVAFVFAVA